jgi:hypothetical protein
MGIESRYDKLIKSLSIHQPDVWDLTKHITSYEMSFQTDAINDEEVCIVPSEPDFQLPNVFLRSRKSVECQRFIDANRSTTNWNESIEVILSAFDEMDFSGAPGIHARRMMVNEEVLEKLIRKRYGR